MRRYGGAGAALAAGLALAGCGASPGAREAGSRPVEGYAAVPPVGAPGPSSWGFVPEPGVTGGAAAVEPAGSGVPLDAPVTQAPSASPPPSVARGTGTPSDKLLAEGDAAYARNDFAAAEKAYRKAGELDRKDPAPIVGAARARVAGHDVPSDYGSAPKSPILAAALKELKRAVALDASYAPAHLEIGRALLVMGRAEEALEALKRAVALAPSDAEAHSALGVAHLAVGKMEDAVRELSRSAELAPGDAERQTNLGTALLAAGRAEPAIAAYERAAKLAPGDARVLNDLGTALLAANDPARAIPHLEAAVARDPQRASYRSNLGYAWHLKGDLAKATALYREAIKLDEKLASAWINLGNALAQSARYAEAREAYGKARAIDPTDPRVKAVLDELDALEKKAGGGGANPGGAPVSPPAPGAAQPGAGR